jgi:hypothetical protein
MNTPPLRLIAIDWSGNKTDSGQRRKIWTADWNNGALTLTNGRTREETADHLIAAARQTPKLVAGLDFAFSYPAWYVREQGCPSAEAFWQHLANGQGEQWLSQCEGPFWGRPGKRCPSGHREPAWQGFRQTDRDVSAGHIRPKSPFQLGGAGAVGTGSLRGIPILHRLHQAGFSIWPFTQPGFPLALEIYPRLFTGPGNKNDPHFRTQHLTDPAYNDLPKEVLTKARDSEDAFDALCSIIGMKNHAQDFGALQPATDPDPRLEGIIWQPAQFLSP